MQVTGHKASQDLSRKFDSLVDTSMAAICVGDRWSSLLGALDTASYSLLWAVCFSICFFRFHVVCNGLTINGPSSRRQARLAMVILDGRGSSSGGTTHLGMQLGGSRHRQGCFASIYFLVLVACNGSNARSIVRAIAAHRAAVSA